MNQILPFMILCGSTIAVAAEPFSFVEHVQPLLVAKCVSCHGPEKQEGGLRSDTLAAAREGGEQGPAIVPGDVAKSLLVQAISFRDPDLHRFGYETEQNGLQNATSKRIHVDILMCRPAMVVCATVVEPQAFDHFDPKTTRAIEDRRYECRSHGLTKGRVTAETT